VAQHIEIVKKLQTLDVSDCRVKDSNNSASGVCSAMDVFNFQTDKPLAQIKIPELAAVEIGKVAKVFVKANVAVVEVSLPLRLGDKIEFRRILRTFVGGDKKDGHSNHQFKSKVTTVSSIRTAASKQVSQASPTSEKTTSQFAIPCEEVGKAGDSVFWIGR